MNFSSVKAITIPEGNVTKIAVGNTVLWEKVTSRIPSEYQEVEWIKNSVPSSTSSGACLDLGFAFDKGAVIHLNFIAHGINGQPFGAAENSGKLRCMISQTASGGYTIYGSNGSGYLGSGISGLGSEVHFLYTIKKGSLKIEDLISGIKSNEVTTQAEYTMTRNLYLFAQNYNTAPRFLGQCSVKSFQYYDNDNNLICDLIPCYRKADGVIGMYDIVRKIFLTNAGTGSFTKGADV